MAFRRTGVTDLLIAAKAGHPQAKAELREYIIRRFIEAGGNARQLCRMEGAEKRSFSRWTREAGISLREVRAIRAQVKNRFRLTACVMPSLALSSHAKGTEEETVPMYQVQPIGALIRAYPDDAKKMLLEAFAKTKGHYDKTALLLNCNIRTLFRWVNQLNCRDEVDAMREQRLARDVDPPAPRTRKRKK